MNHIGVIGAGAWGTALAIASIRANLKTTIWSISSDEVEAINQRHEHIYRLPGIPLDPSLHATLDPQELARAEGFILSPPAQFMRSTCETFSKVLSSHAPLVIASKGIEIGTTCLMSEVVRDFFPNNPLFVLSGPSFASEVAKRSVGENISPLPLLSSGASVIILLPDFKCSASVFKSPM